MSDADLDAMITESKTPEDLLTKAMEHDLHMRETIRLVMKAYDCSLVEAKEVYSQVKFGMSLSDYQETYLLPGLRLPPGSRRRSGGLSHGLDAD